MYYSDELYHHGIKGQRWGRRNGPPYPLSPQTHASVVRSAGRGRSAGSSRRGRIGELTDEDTKYDPKFRTKAERDEYERRSARAQRIKKGLMIGAGAAALAGTGYLAYRNRGAIANKARAVGNDIRDRAYIEKEIAKSRMGNLKGKAKDLGGRMRADALIARGKAEDSFVRNANKVRNSINTGRYAANRGSRYLKSLAADKYGYRAVNTITRGTKLAAKGAALGAAGNYIYKKRKKKRR